MVFVFVSGCYGRSLDFEDLIFRTSFLVAGPSALLQIGLVLVQEVAKSNFEFLIKFVLF